jgi:hypothetical protein
MEADVDQAELEQLQRAINHEMRERFALGSAQRAVLLQPGDDPAIEPGQLMVRVFLPPLGEGEDYEQALAAWQDAIRRAWTRSGASSRSGCPRRGCSSSPSTTRTEHRCRGS